MPVIGYDELLYERVKQLKEIDERLERMLTTPNGIWDWDSTKVAITRLRHDLTAMILKAEAEHDAF